MVWLHGLLATGICVPVSEQIFGLNVSFAGGLPGLLNFRQNYRVAVSWTECVLQAMEVALSSNRYYTPKLWIGLISFCRHIHTVAMPSIL